MLELDQQSLTRTATASTNRALTKETAGTSGGVRLRGFHWFLYDARHMANSGTVSRVAGEPADLITEILQAAFAEDLDEQQIQAALIASRKLEQCRQRNLQSPALHRITDLNPI